MDDGAIQRLSESFGVSPYVRFERDPHGLIRARVTNSSCEGTIYLHGAQVTQYRPVGEQEMLFVSDAADFSEGLPIRGGVPICFPWFAAKPGDEEAPSHGLARTCEWNLWDLQASKTEARIALAATIENFQVRFSVNFGAALEMSLDVENLHGQKETFEAALHSYFSVSDVNHISIQGLESAAFLDQLNNERCRASGQPIRFSQEIDRIYFSKDEPILLLDKGWTRQIIIERFGSTSVVVWNPWIDKSRRLSDFSEDEWPSMCCVETAAVRGAAIDLAPRQSHRMTTVHRIVSERLD